MPSELKIRVETTTPNYPTVRLLVDGVDVLDLRGISDGNDADALLGSGALLPMDPPRRVAFYGCGCGVFSCQNITGLILRKGDVVVWSDFRSLMGTYDGPLPDPEDGADPWASATAEHRQEFWEPSFLALPTVTFAAEQYLAEVTAATADRSWDTHTRRVVREMLLLRPTWSVWAEEHGDRIDVNPNPLGNAPGNVLRVPPGDPGEVARTLVALLADEHSQ